jgi:exosortase D (VPLPA-CTERM-specific)
MPENSTSTLPDGFVPPAKLSDRYFGFLVVLSALVAATVFYKAGISSLLSAWQRPEYSHGFIIPILALIIAVKRDGGAENSAEPKKFGLGYAALAFAILIGIFGNKAGIADIVTYGLLLAIAAMTIVLLGRKRALKLWPAWIYLGFMLPLPNFVYWPLSIKLQFISSQIGVAIVSLMGIPVFLDGNIIDLGNYQLQVAEACSGLRYLFPLMSFGFLFATLYRGPAWQKCLIFLATAPITVIMNSIRIGIIGILVNSYGIAQAEGFLHLFEGWVIFGVCISLLCLLVILLQVIARKRMPFSEALDLDLQGLPNKIIQLTRVTFSKPLLAAVLMLLVAAGASSILFQRLSVHPQRTEFAQFPMKIGDWTGKPSYLDFETERVLAADDYLMADFVLESKSLMPVNLLISYYQSQTEGSGIHSPEVCIPGGGWEVSRWEQVPVALSFFENDTLKVNRAIIQKGKDRQLVYYWFEAQGRHITNDYVAKGLTVWDSILRGRTDGALVRVITPIESEDIKSADERLQSFLEISVSKLPEFVPI